MSQAAWDREYSKADLKWPDGRPLFALTVLQYLPKKGRILELGAGVGNDSRFFAGRGYEVVSTDFSLPALALNRELTPEALGELLSTQRLDMTEVFPFCNGSFDAVYAHMCLHYFDLNTTRRVVSEVRRVLKPGGVFAFMTNSTSDPDFGTGPKIEDDFFLIRGEEKRYFSVESARNLVACQFDVQLIDNHGEAYFKQVRGVHNLIRCIAEGRKTPPDAHQ